MENKRSKILTREQLTEKYHLSEDEQVYLLDTFVLIEEEMYRFLSAHV